MYVDFAAESVYRCDATSVNLKTTNEHNPQPPSIPHRCSSSGAGGRVSRSTMAEHETWQQIPGYEGLYEASDQGRVRSVDRRVTFKDGRSRLFKSKILRPGKMGRNRDYLFVSLCKDGVQRTWPLHQLIMLAFVGPRPDKMDTCHNNGNGLDNRLSNLRYDTHAANITEADYIKISDDDVREMRRRYTYYGETFSSLARHFGVTKATVSKAVRRKTWKHVL